jgi:hypothetical protein
VLIARVSIRKWVVGCQGRWPNPVRLPANYKENHFTVSNILEINFLFGGLRQAARPKPDSAMG